MLPRSFTVLLPWFTVLLFTVSWQTYPKSSLAPQNALSVPGFGIRTRPSRTIVPKIAVLRVPKKAVCSVFLTFTPV